VTFAAVMHGGMKGVAAARARARDGRRARANAESIAQTISARTSVRTATMSSQASRTQSSSASEEASTLAPASVAQAAADLGRAYELGLWMPRPGSALLQGWLAQNYHFKREKVETSLIGNGPAEYTLAIQKNYEPELARPRWLARAYGGVDATPKEELTPSNMSDVHKGPALWKWLCRAQDEGWRSAFIVTGAIVGQNASAKSKFINFGSGSARKSTFLYNVRSNKTMDIELTPRGEAMFDYLAANMLLRQAAGRWLYGPMYFPALSSNIYVTLAGLPHDWEGQRLHQLLVKRIEDSGRIVDERPNTPITVVPLTELSGMKLKGGWLWPPQVFVWVLPPLNSHDNRTRIAQDIETVLQARRSLDFRVVLCGLEFAGHRGSNVTVGDQWDEFMGDMTNVASGAAAHDHNMRFLSHVDDIQHQWLNEWSNNGFTLSDVTRGLNAGELDKFGEMTSARARKWFDEYTAPYLGKQHDARWFLMNALFGGLRFINRLRSRTRSFGDSIVETTQHTHKFLRGEMTEEDIQMEEGKLVSLYATEEGKAKMFPPLTRIFEALRRFRFAVVATDLRAQIKALTSRAVEITASQEDADVVRAEALLRDMWNMKGRIDDAVLFMPADDPTVRAFYVQLAKVEQITKLGEMHRQAFLDTVQRINDLVSAPMPVEGGPQALEAAGVETERLMIELSSRIQARMAGSAIQVSKDKMADMSEDDFTPELMDAIQLDSADVDVAAKANERGRSRVLALNAARDLLHAADDIDPVKLREKLRCAKELGVDQEIVDSASTKLENLERQIQAFIRANRITDSLLPAPTSTSGSDSDRWVNAGRNIWYNEAEILGRGSLGTIVFKGYYDEGAGNRVVRRDAAIKRIPLPPGERGDNMRGLVEREIAIHRHLNERSTRVTYILGSKLDVDRGDGAIYSAMELCGESLATWLKNAGSRGGVSTIAHGERMDAVRSLAHAVEDVHLAGVTHNDIKADNCLRGGDGEFKLADLGLGVRLKDANKATDGNTYSLTTFEGYGVNIGLQGRPPELLLNAPLTPKVDVWSFGCLMYTIMTGFQSPYKLEKKVNSRNTSGGSDDFNASTALDVGFENQRIVKGQFSLQGLETARLPMHTTVAARELLHRMLDPDPRERPTSTEVCEHPALWGPGDCMEAVREVFDRRMVRALTEQEEADLAHTVWKGRPGQAERAAQAVRSWKSIVAPSLLARAERYVRRSADMQQTWEESRANKFAATVASRRMNRRSETDRAKDAKVPDAAPPSSIANLSYGDRLFDLVRFARNMHEHPPLELERAEMLRALGTNAATLLRPEDANADPWTSSRKIVEAYVAHTFPDLPLFAHYLLKPGAPGASERDARE